MLRNFADNTLDVPPRPNPRGPERPPRPRPVPPFVWSGSFTDLDLSLVSTGTTFDVLVWWDDNFNAVEGYVVRRKNLGTSAIIFKGTYPYAPIVDVNPGAGNYQYVPTAYYGSQESSPDFPIVAINVPSFPVPPLPWIDPIVAELVDTGTGYDAKLTFTSEFITDHLVFGTYAGQGTLLGLIPSGGAKQIVDVGIGYGTHTYIPWTRGYYWGDTSGGYTYLILSPTVTTDQTITGVSSLVQQTTQDIAGISCVVYTGTFSSATAYLLDTGTSYDVRITWADTCTPVEYDIRDSFFDENGVKTFLYPGTVAVGAPKEFWDYNVQDGGTHSYRITAFPYTTTKVLSDVLTPARYADGDFLNAVWENVKGFERAATVAPGVTFEFTGSYWFEYSGSLAGTIAGAAVTAQEYHYPDTPVLDEPVDEGESLGETVVLRGTVSDPNASEALDGIVYGMEANPASPFKVIVVPDMQKWYDDAPFMAPVVFDWIAAQATADASIKCVLSEGDITDSNADEEWWYGTNAWYRLDGIVPYTIIPGNHDKDLGVALKLNHYFNADTRFFSAAGTFATYPSPDFGGYNDMSANAFTMSAGSLNWLLVSVGDMPHAGLRAFAQEQAALYPNHKAILTTHGMLWDNGIFYPEEKLIYTDTVEAYDNFFMVLCGHRHGEVRRWDKWGSARSVDIMMANYQTGTNGGENIRILNFIPNENRIDVQTYNPYRDTYETGTDSQFSIDVPMGNGTILARAEGLASGDSVTHTWAGLTPGQKYIWWVRTLDETGRANDSEMRSFVA